MSGAQLLGERFQNEMERDHIADAYLLVGNAAQALQEAALSCASRLLHAEGQVEQHADLVVFDPAELGVDGLRVEHITHRKEGVPCLEEALRYRPVVSKHRAVLLFGADRMTADAHAALLKTTEEPPADTVLFFTARELHGLSPALRSRCRIWRVPQAPAAELESKAAAMGIDADAWQLLLQVYGSGEGVLDTNTADREFLLEQHPLLRNWLHGQGDWSWCVVPEASKLAEQRRLAGLLLQAARAWLVTPGAQIRSTAQAGPYSAEEATWELHRESRAQWIEEALDDLFGQVSPALVLASLAQRERSSPEPAS